MNYTTYRYLYPPRPKNAIPPKLVRNYDTKSFMHQPKLNGSCCVVFTDGVQVVWMNRHKQILNNVQIDDLEILRLHPGDGWFVLVGEYMNKSKKNHLGENFNHTLILHDILVYDSKYLVNVSQQDRYQKLQQIIGPSWDYDGYIQRASERIFIVTDLDAPAEKFEALSQIDMYEGVVIKSRIAKLEPGFSEMNNHKSMIKSRKATKNYKY